MTHAAPKLPPTATHLRLIMTDETERRDTPTIEAPPPSDAEPRTNPENDAPAPLTAIRPPPSDPWDTSFLNADDSTFSRAVKMIADAARANAEAANERKSFEETHLKLQGEILTCVQRAERSQEANFKILKHEVQELKASDVRQDGRLAEGDERFAKIERSIAELKDELIALVTREMQAAAVKIEALERRLADAKNANADRPPSPNTPG